LYYCCSAAKTVNKQSYIHASHHVAEMAIFKYMNTHFFYRYFRYFRWFDLAYMLEVTGYLKLD